MFSLVYHLKYFKPRFLNPKESIVLTVFGFKNQIHESLHFQAIIWSETPQNKSWKTFQTFFWQLIWFQQYEKLICIFIIQTISIQAFLTQRNPYASANFCINSKYFKLGFLSQKEFIRLLPVIVYHYDLNFVKIHLI